MTDFAISGIPWPFAYSSPRLFGTHDPMVHPGKGVLRLKVNGVSGGRIKDLEVYNLESDTRLGTKSINPYEQIITQQKPYMIGYRMNMVQALTISEYDDIQLENIDIRTVKLKIGLVRGLAT